MGPGVTLMVVGAILAFAVRDRIEAINLPVVGLILMIAGAAVILHDRRGASRDREVVRRESDPDAPGRSRVVRESYHERDTD